MTAKTAKQIVAKFDMKGCIRCGKPIVAGKDMLEQITMPNGRKRWVHVGCEPTGLLAPATITQPTGIDRSEVAAIVRDEVSGEIATLNTRINALSAKASVGMTEEERQALAAVADGQRRLEEKVQLLDKARPMVIDIRQPDGTLKRVIDNKRVHPKFEEVMFYLSCGDDVMLVGPSGCGKTHMAAQIAKARGVEFDFVSCTIDTSKSEIFGSREPDGDRFCYQMSAFGKRFTQGGVFLWDEVDAIDPNVFVSINAPLSNGILSMPKNYEMPKANRHPDFVCICAANTYGGGGDRRYVGRNRLDGASLDRFVFVDMDYDTGVEELLCPDAELLSEMHRIRQRCNDLKIERFVTTRFIARAYRWLQAGKDIQFCRDSLMRAWREDERRKVMA